MNKIRVGNFLAAIQDATGVSTSRIADVLLEPQRVTLTVLLLDEHGCKYVDPDTGSVAVELREYPISYATS